jgi:hypothetical protein
VLYLRDDVTANLTLLLSGENYIMRSFVICTLALILLPISHCPLKCAVALTRQHIIRSSVFQVVGFFTDPAFFWSHVRVRKLVYLQKVLFLPSFLPSSALAGVYFKAMP